MTTPASAPSGNPQPLNEPLPRDVEAGGLSRFALYQRYPAFTWPWFLRRAAVFWPFAVAWGLFQGVWHASSMTAWQDALPLGLRAAGGNLVEVSAGPLLALAVRYRRLPYPAERVLVVAAVIVGLIIASDAEAAVAHYHDMLMARHMGMSMSEPAAVTNLSRMLGVTMGRLPRWIGLILIGGGPELLSYITERRRLAERQRRRDVEALRRDKADADLKMAVLQAQIEPHFLFNTLASVSSLIATSPDRAVSTIDALSDYLRTTLPKLRREGGVEGATLGHQVSICAQYLELMNLRMGGRITVEIDTPPELAEAPFPPLLLISLVENAVKHGIEPKPGPGAIAIRGRRRQGADETRLEISVEDDGAGLHAGSGAGVGLANVHAQLQHRFGPRATLEVAGRDGGGVCARISVPWEPA
ncbi:sensor histidine kinase [Phenylobacterium sp.]|jgi:signal transduction histidine kinase|uniref:sensor histidine kinase n=1 Tax=Phenylobacterium sp. TaxID=1871053 RepID=UPI002E3322AD|nr:histidine kinase [Phenylobacterium sp.]HEX3363645.1 histidine kinase [Phenylobacterium sp.]